MIVMKRQVPWLLAVLVTTVVFGTIYGVGQQILRMNANDPQIQLAEDTASYINSGADPAKLITGDVNLKASLAPFIDIYNAEGQPIAGNGRLNGSLPAVPIGMLQASQGQAYSTVTWQPDTGVRIAAATAISNTKTPYYVVAGRSLREVEKQENHVLVISAAGWLAALVILGFSYYLVIVD